MARLARVVIPGYAYHVTHWGATAAMQYFFDDEDREVYIAMLDEYAHRRNNGRADDLLFGTTIVIDNRLKLSDSRPMNNRGQNIGFFLTGFLLLFTFPLSACMWDRDTLADEARNHGNVVDVLTGRFPRNPPLYYEMRLTRVGSEIQKAPQNLALYDDAGVACDRLNRGSEAITWMDKKRVALDKAEESDETKEHWYRYHANLGTFQAHEWFRNGASTSNTALLAEGARNIEQAIEINPEAHFGREKYQLQFMNWLLSDPDPIYKGKYSEMLATFLDETIHQPKKLDAARTKELKKASNGLLGLIHLGNAWESIDVFYTLNLIHAMLDNSSIQNLAFHRVKELQGMEKQPALGKKMTEKQLKDIPENPGILTGSGPEIPVPIDKLRQNADKWQESRTAYMLERLNKGEHSDTHKDFWNDYTEVAQMELPVSLFTDDAKHDEDHVKKVTDDAKRDEARVKKIQERIDKQFFTVGALISAPLILVILYLAVMRKRRLTKA